MHRSLRPFLSRTAARRHRPGGALLPAALAALSLACDGSDRVRVSGSPEDHRAPADRLATAVSDAADDRTSPGAYRDLARAVDELEPFGSRRLERRAERALAFGALPRLRARADAPPRERAEALALTVWPAALGVAPEPGESAPRYLERACADELARHCQHTVPRHRALVVSDRVWRRFHSRARAAYRACRECAGEESYERALEDFHRHQSEVSARRAEVGARAHPRRWPQAREDAPPYPEGAPLLVVDRDGLARWEGERASEGRPWREALAEYARPGEILGLHLRPSAGVTLVEAAADAAADAGYRDVALAAVAPEYPHEHRAYLIAASNPERGAPVRARGGDTVQILVQRLARAAAPESQPARLARR